MPKPYIGMPCAYRCRPGQARMGQMDLAAIVTKVYDDDRADLVIFQPRTNITDALRYEQVAPMSEAVTGHCWHVMAPVPLMVAPDGLEDSSDDWMKPGAITWVSGLAEVNARIAALEAGRSKKKAAE